MKIQKILIIVILLGLVLPLVSLAGSYMVGDREIKYEGLVPCGKAAYDAAKESPEVIKPCQFCHFFVTFGGLVNFLIFAITIPAAVLLLVAGGAMFIFASGQPGLVKKGNDIIKSVAIGLVIIFVAYLAVGTFLKFIGLADWTFTIYRSWWETKFFQLNCPINL